MARLLVVSRSMALALRLADAHDVVEAPVDDLERLVPDPDVDVLVLDVGEPALAVTTLDRLRATGIDTPLLVVSGYQPAWAGLAAVEIPGVVVVPLPITRAALLDGIDRLLDAWPADRRADGPADPDRTRPDGLPRADLAPAGTPIALPHSLPEPMRPRPVREVDVEGPVVDPPLVTALPTEPVRAGDVDGAADEDDVLRPFARGGGPGPADDDPTPPADGPAPADDSWSAGGFDWWPGPGGPPTDPTLGLPGPATPSPPPAPSPGPSAPDPAPAPDPDPWAEPDRWDEPPARRLRRGWPPAEPSDSAAPTPVDDLFAPAPPAPEPSWEELFAGLGARRSRRGAPAVPAHAGTRLPADPASSAPTSDAPSEASFALPAPVAPPAVSGPLAGVPAPPTGPILLPDTDADDAAPAPAPDEVMAYRRALLGRAAGDVDSLSVFRSRLGPRPYRTSLGPGGVSPELIALGHAEAPVVDDALRVDEPPQVLRHAPAGPDLAPGTDPSTDPATDPATDPERTAELPVPAGRRPGDGPGPVGPGDPSVDGPADGSTADDAEADDADGPDALVDLVDLVDLLVERAAELERVQDVAARVAARCLAPARAVAAAVLVPDGVAWRVEGGAGLTPAERRVVLGIGHRLVAGVAPGDRYLVVDGTEPHREHLAGAPLAGRRHVLAVPLPSSQSFVVLARDHDQPFDEADVSALGDELAAGALDLRTAMRARVLARLLDPLRTSDGRN